jgi:hypothetical protein
VFARGFSDVQKNHTPADNETLGTTETAQHRWPNFSGQRFHVDSWIYWIITQETILWFCFQLLAPTVLLHPTIAAATGNEVNEREIIINPPVALFTPQA